MNAYASSAWQVTVRSATQGCCGMVAVSGVPVVDDIEGNCNEERAEGKYLEAEHEHS